MSLDFKQMHDLLMKELRLMHYPVGMTFYYSEEEAAAAKKRYEFYVPNKPISLCQAELGARMEGLNIYFDMGKLWCKSARICFGLKEIDDSDLVPHAKWCVDEEQTRRVVESKPRLAGKAPVAASLIPLGNLKGMPDLVHFICDNMQAYHLLNDWMAVADVHPFHPNMCVNSAVCGGSVYTMMEGQANITLACAGSYNSGKMERGEINVMIPGKHIGPMAERMKKRVEEKGGISLTRPGQPFPGVDICNNCPLITFKKAE